MDILIMLMANCFFQHIAKQLGKSPNCITQEIKKLRVPVDKGCFYIVSINVSIADNVPKLSCVVIAIFVMCFALAVRKLVVHHSAPLTRKRCATGQLKLPTSANVAENSDIALCESGSSIPTGTKAIRDKLLVMPIWL